jgi:MoxR-like ATPase
MERQSAINPKLGELINNIERVIIGKRDVIELVITAMLAGGHILIEDVPGVGKTQLAASLASSCGGVFGRLQLTPDVMPTDITGFSMVNPQTYQTEFKAGVSFCNFLLADEINRASPKSQSALLEIMEEEQVTVDGNTYALPKPFMVLATQNPVETYGTYHLPEAQMDRFLMKISMGYPGKANELAMLNRDENAVPHKLARVISCEEITALREQAASIGCSTAVGEYIVDLVEATRHSDKVRLGASPRASIALFKASKARALLAGRSYVLPDDVKALAPYIISHRLMLNSGAKDAYSVVEEILNTVNVPTGNVEDTF